MSKLLKMKNQMIFSVNSYGARNNDPEWGNLDSKRQNTIYMFLFSCDFSFKAIIVVFQPRRD